MYVMKMTKTTLGKVIQQTMTRKKIGSNREFARQADVSPQLINDLVNEKPRDLDMSSIVKLSDFTGISIMTLVAIAFPEALNVDLEVEYLLDAEKLRQLPPNKRTLARGYINNAYTEGDEE